MDRRTSAEQRLLREPGLIWPAPSKCQAMRDGDSMGFRLDVWEGSVLIVISGLPGVGKSMVAELLADRLGPRRTWRRAGVTTGAAVECNSE